MSEIFFQTYGFHMLRKCIVRGMFTYAPPHSKLALKFLPSRSRYKDTTNFPGQNSFENLFPPTAERVGIIYDLLYQN